jgi:imidazole glycerol-phosphate synthase subunit HisH
MITVVDYHMGNIGSIANMIAKVGAKARVTADPAVLRDADKLILPGVGHFDRGMGNLHELGLVPVLEELVVQRRRPLLGICLGMQLLCRSSEEGTRPGLGFVDAEVKRFDVTAHPNTKVPHMGWNVARPVKDSPLFDRAPPEPQRFYFVHSYFTQCHDQSDVLATTSYAGEFCSAFAHGNIYGVQFHPEKSHAFGMELFRRFVAL